MKKKEQDWKEQLGGLVFSTHDNSEADDFFDLEDEALDPKDQNLRIWLDKKSRKGKSVSLIKGFDGSDEQLKELASALKKLCGVGGSAKYGEILIQGDHRNKIRDYLIQKGFTNTKLAGG